MPWEILPDHPQCPEGRPYAVVKADGEIEGCHATEEAARAQQDALYASEADDVDEESEGEDETGVQPVALAEDDTHRPPAGVQQEGQRALEWIADGHAGDGFTDVGRRRAAQLANAEPVSVRTIRRMANYLSRHQGDSKAEGWRPGEDGYPSPGRVAWAAWGGDPAIPWTRRILRSEEARTAAATPEGMDRAPFVAVLAIEGEVTGDGRLLAPGSLTWRDLPLPLMFQDRTPEGQGNAHAGADFAGDITAIERDGDRIVARGEVDLGRAAGAELYRLLEAGSSLRGVSVDLDSVMAEYTGPDGTPLDELDDEDMAALDPARVVQRFTEGRIMGATVTPFPAIAGGASIALVRPEDALVAALRPADLPPAAWYEDPHLPGPTPLTVTDDGRVFGHIALWSQGHIGFQGQKVTPPRSASGYGFFATGSVRARCGDCPADAVEDVPVGVLTLGGGHASTAPGVSAAAAQAHYDEVGLAAAFVGAGEDAHGIWIAGTLAPGLTDAQVALLRASSPSGDWRVPPGGHGLELVAVCAVNVPGFPVARGRVHVAESQVLALAASGANLGLTVGGPHLGDLEARIARLESIAEPLRDLAVQRYESQLATSDPRRALRDFARRRRS